MQNKIEKKITLTKEQEITFETGRIARQANGSILISSSGTQVLVAATAKKEVVEKLSFFPLSVDYIEKFYASGRIPGGYLKRENRPGDKEILTSRLIDRPIRPLFPKDFLCETQIVATLMSYDDSVSPIPLAITGTSAALHISDIPFAGPIAGIRLGLVDNEYLINPNDNELKSSKLDLIIAGSKDAILMVEACANFLSEAEMLKAIDFAHKHIQTLCVAQDELREQVGLKKRSVPVKDFDAKKAKNFEKHIAKDLEKSCYIKDKLERYSALEATNLFQNKKVVEQLGGTGPYGLEKTDPEGFSLMNLLNSKTGMIGGGLALFAGGCLAFRKYFCPKTKPPADPATVVVDPEAPIEPQPEVPVEPEAPVETPTDNWGRWVRILSLAAVDMNVFCF